MSASTAAAAPAQPTVPSSLLWAHILQRPRPPIAPPPRADLTQADKAKAATRILLHDTQSRLETFAKSAESLLTETRRVRVEVERVREECAGAGEEVADEVVGAVNRAQGVIVKVIGEPAQAKDVETLAANVVGLGKLVDAQMHILTALQTSVGILVEQQTRAQDRHAQTLAALGPLLALPSAIDALSLRVDRILPIQHSSPRSTTSSDPTSSSVGARSSSSPKRAHDLVGPSTESATKRRKLGTGNTERTPSNASSATRRDVNAIFPLPKSAQRAHSRHSSVSSLRPHPSTASSGPVHPPAVLSSAHARTNSSSSSRAHIAVHSTAAVFETPRRDRASPSSSMRAPGSAIRIPGSATRAPPSASLIHSASKPPRASPFVVPSSPPQQRASSPLAHTAQRAPSSLIASMSVAPGPPRKTLPTSRITPRRALAGPGIPPALPVPPRQQLPYKASSPLNRLPAMAVDSSTRAAITQQPAPTTATSEFDIGPSTSSNLSVLVHGDEEAEEPLMLIGSPVRPQNGKRWIDVGDSEDEEES